MCHDYFNRIDSRYAANNLYYKFLHKNIKVKVVLHKFLGKNNKAETFTGRSEGLREEGEGIERPFCCATC